LIQTYYKGIERATDQALCKAQILQLARTSITRSEQSISFIGGWRFDSQGYSPKLATIFCAADQPEKLRAMLTAADLPIPRVHIILMTHTAQLGMNPEGKQYSTFARTGTCRKQPLNKGLKLSPQQMYLALLGRNKNGDN